MCTYFGNVKIDCCPEYLLQSLQIYLTIRLCGFRHTYSEFAVISTSSKILRWHKVRNPLVWLLLWQKCGMINYALEPVLIPNLGRKIVMTFHSVGRNLHGL